LNAIPYVSIVDAGTIDLVRSFGVTVVSSADLVGQFEAHLTLEDWNSHQQAGVAMQMIKDGAFQEIGRRINAGQNPSEYDIYLFMKNLMEQQGLVFDDGPIVAVNEHAADPHFEPTAQNSFKMKKGDLVLLDLWARKNQPHSIYYDITWMGYIGKEIPVNIQELFGIVRNARQAALDFIKERFQSGQDIFGWEVDDVCRHVIVKAGYGEFFIHRTGHNIGEQVHGNGVNIDNLETKDERRIQPGTCFSIEPGIYLPQQKLGFRSEIDVFVTDQGNVEVSGAQQESVVAILI
jgi:Xaa-Pro dipeptidase